MRSLDVLSLTVLSVLAVLQASAATEPSPAPGQAGAAAASSAVAPDMPVLSPGVVPPRPSGLHVCAPPPAWVLDVGKLGVSTIHFTITAQGTVADVAVLRPSGNWIVDLEAKNCVAGWLYSPATKDGQAVPFQASVDVGWIGKVYSHTLLSLGGIVHGTTEQEASSSPGAVVAPAEEHARFSCEHRHIDYNGVLLAYYVEPDGSVDRVSVLKSSGDAEEDKDAVECVEKRSYKPATQGGHPVEARLTAMLYYLPFEYAVPGGIPR